LLAAASEKAFIVLPGGSADHGRQSGARLCTHLRNAWPPCCCWITSCRPEALLGKTFARTRDDFRKEIDKHYPTIVKRKRVDARGICDTSVQGIFHYTKW
jgi:hypothetical protein